MTVIHPDNKIHYREGDRVEFTLYGDVSKLLRGIIVGIATSHIIDQFIVRLDEMLPDWAYSCVIIQHTFIRPLGDNRPFLCEGVSRI